MVRTPALLLLALTTACANPADEGRQRMVGIIDNGGATQTLVAPDTVHAGVAFTATVTTFGSACRLADGAQVRVSGSTAEITPYDLTPPGGTMCIAVEVAMPRSVSVTLSFAGTATLRVRGRNFDRAEITKERTIVVLP